MLKSIGVIGILLLSLYATNFSRHETLWLIIFIKITTPFPPIDSNTCEQFLDLRVGFGLDFVFVCLFRLSIVCVFMLA